MPRPLSAIARRRQAWPAWASLSLAAVLALGLLSAAPAARAADRALEAAVEADDEASLRQLLQRGANPNERSVQGHTPLYLALRGGALKAAQLLMAHPAIDIQATNPVGESALMMAALRGQLSVMQQLIDRGARVDGEGWTPLHYAATGNEPRAVSLLLARGARVDVRSPNDSTPLMMAARYGAEASVDLLLAAGADPRLVNQRQMDAAAFARSVDRQPLADRLHKAAAAR